MRTIESISTCVLSVTRLATSGTFDLVVSLPTSLSSLIMEGQCFSQPSWHFGVRNNKKSYIHLIVF